MDDVNATVGDAVRGRGEWFVPGLSGALLYVWFLRPKTPLEGVVAFFGGSAATVFMGPFLREKIPVESKELVPFLGFLLGFCAMMFMGVLHRIVDKKLEGTLTSLSDAWMKKLGPPSETPGTVAVGTSGVGDSKDIEEPRTAEEGESSQPEIPTVEEGVHNDG